MGKGGGSMTFLQKVERRAERRRRAEALAAQQQDAHMKTRHDMFAVEAERQTAASLSRQRQLQPGGRTMTVLGRQVMDREVDNPLLTDGLAYSDQRNAYLKVRVEENALTRIGALCFIRRRQRHHEVTAERFKNLYEARYGAGSPAMDASRVQVDTSPIAHDAGMAGKIDRTFEIERAEIHLGKAAFNRIVACVVLGIPCAESVDTLPSGQPNKRQLSKAVDALLGDLDSLATLWRYRSVAA